MAKPIGVAKATKDNSNKHPYERQQWMEGKKVGRPKQVWVWDIEPYDNGTIKTPGFGHWEKIND